MTEFVLVRIKFMKGKNHAEVDRGYVNEVPIAPGRNFFRLLEVLGSSGFTMVNFDVEAMFGNEQIYFMLQRPESPANRQLNAVVNEAAGG